MKKILSLAVASTAVMAVPAFAADTATDDFNINASVAEVCTMEGINDIDLGEISVRTTAGSSALLINTLLETETAGRFWLSCNENNRMTLTPTNGVLQNTTRSVSPGDDPGFKDTINYVVNAVNYRNGFFQPGCASNVGCVSFSRGAIHRQVDMRATVSAFGNQDGRPLAGDYQDTVTVTVTII